MHGAPAPLLDPHPPTLGSRGRRRLEGPSQLGRVPAMPSDTRVRTETGVQAWLCPAVTRTRSLPGEGELVRCMPQAHLPESPFLALQMLSGLTQTKPSRSRCLLSPARVLASVPWPRTVSPLCDPGAARGWRGAGLTWRGTLSPAHGGPPASRRLSWTGVRAQRPVHQEHGLKEYPHRALQGCALCCRPP